MSSLKNVKTIPFNSEWNHGLDQQTLDRLAALPLEEQLDCYKVACTTYFAEFSYGKEDSSRSFGHVIDVTDCDEFLGIVVDNGVMVGIYITSWYHYPRPLFVGQCACVYSVYDEDGTGVDERDDYVTLLLN